MHRLLTSHLSFLPRNCPPFQPSPWATSSCPPQVQRDFEELPEQAVDSLRDSLLTLLVKYSKYVPQPVQLPAAKGMG